MKHNVRTPYFVHRFLRTCSSSLYKMESHHPEGFRSFFNWRVLRWVLLPTLVLAFILTCSLYFFIARSTEEEIVVISDNLIENTRNFNDLDTQSTLFRPPDSTNKTDDYEPDDLLDLDVSDPPNILEEYGIGNKNPINHSDSSEFTFVDKLLSSFQQSNGESGLRFHPGGIQLDKHGNKEGTTQGLVVSPTLPSVLPPGHQPTRDPPLNHTESVCRSPGIALCRGILPWDLTSLPSLPGPEMPSLSNTVAMSQALPYFEMVLQSGCSPRAKQFLCPLLEPQCQPYGKPITPPCRKTCRVVAEDCSDFILGTLDLSKVFKCDLYPDSSNSSVCVDLTKGNNCRSDEVKCEDGSCIPQRWKCDGHVDCPGGLDEINCILCQHHEFTCESKDKCIPLAYRCDGHIDCSDGSDENNCHQPDYDKVMHSHASPCPSGELRCVDGRCISLSQICDGSSDCSDAADESNCRPPYRP